MNMTLLSVIITETIKKERQNMRKRIAVLMVLAIILGTVCAFAEEEEAEDLAGEWELYVGGQSRLYVYLERDGTFRGVSSEDTWDKDSITEGTWTYDGTELALTAEGETLLFTRDGEDGSFAGEKDGGLLLVREWDTDEVFLLGLWRAPEDPSITPERQALFDRVEQELHGNYALVPRLYRGCWGKDGTNHAFLCQVKAADPAGKPEWDWELVFLYELGDDGIVEIWSTEILDLDKYCIFSANG